MSEETGIVEHRTIKVSDPVSCIKPVMVCLLAHRSAFQMPPYVRGPLGHRDQKPGYGDKADGEAPWFILKL